MRRHRIGDRERDIRQGQVAAVADLVLAGCRNVLVLMRGQRTRKSVHGDSRGSRQHINDPILQLAMSYRVTFVGRKRDLFAEEMFV